MWDSNGFSNGMQMHSMDRPAIHCSTKEFIPHHLLNDSQEPRKPNWIAAAAACIIGTSVITSILSNLPS